MEASGSWGPQSPEADEKFAGGSGLKSLDGATAAVAGIGLIMNARHEARSVF